ncbi:MAG: LCP family protein [Acidobacteria bacterium]|nr:LCP family protein [Acidobacteriota bacterium]
MAQQASPRITAVCVMDSDSWTANTDNIIVVDAERQRLVWIPRDLWTDVVGDRINTAYQRGGHELLCAALGEWGWPVESSVVVQRSAVERALSTLRITVPVDRTRRYWYPMLPRLRLQDGRKLVQFDPPEETLEGERIHQWLGARRSADTLPPKFPDMDRIERQQTFIRRLLQEGFDFSKLLDDLALVRLSDAGALGPVSAVRVDWELHTFSQFEPETRDGKMILIRRRSLLRRIWGNRG